jgi:integrase
MIIRDNWKLAKRYLQYRVDVDGIGPGSAEVEATYLRHILEWADGVPFSRAQSIRPVLPEYVGGLAGRGEATSSSGTHARKILATARRFFDWAALNQAEYRGLKGAWTATLKARKQDQTSKKPDAVSLDEVRAIAAAPARSILERRAQAGALLMYLSGVRVGALVTISIGAVDLHSRTVKQHPSLGVRTKNRTHATTSLLDIPELYPAVEAWDGEVRSRLPGSAMWFAPLSPDTGELDPSRKVVGEHRVAVARKNLRDFLKSHGLPYHAPHAFRHGHIHYGYERAKTMADLKALSMNVMHKGIRTTDEVYSRLSDSDVHSRVVQLGKSDDASTAGSEEEFRRFQQFLRWERAEKEKRTSDGAQD